MGFFSASVLTPVLAYIGPGAGFAFLGSFLILFVAILLAILAVLSFPLRFTVGFLLRRRKHGPAKARRVIILGLDGMDPARLRDLMRKGQMPNFQTLADEGTFTELRTTCPSMSPVAWSSFATGVNPGKHNIFDFLNRDLRTYRPELSSSRIRTFTRRGWRRTPGSEMVLLRKSQPFWKVLGEHGVFSTILRVPITFPPEKFYGLSLSAMCVPDLRGSQGSFTVYETVDSGVSTADGTRIRVTVKDGRIDTHLPGPQIGSDVWQVPVRIRFGQDADRVDLRISGRTHTLRRGIYSDWIAVSFGAGLRKAHGICRFLLVSKEPGFKLYVTPIHIDPERPAMPVSAPAYYSIYLAKLLGPYATLGLAEDTWALSDGVIDDAAFLRQTYDIHAERKAMFDSALRRTRTGVCCCVFDLLDRVQHMFFRYADVDHRASKPDPAGMAAIDQAYRAMDELVGETMARMRLGDVLLVMSDHGFASFRRNVNINRWLEQEGYLVRLSGSETAGDYLSGVDWAKTRAYSFGLSGIYINTVGREAQGVVRPEDKDALKAEITAKLAGLTDPANGACAIRRVYDSARIYEGPYRDNGPDLLVGYERGYRVSWETAKGQTTGDVFTDNTKAWSGDHCMDPDLVPGILVCSRPLNLDGRKPHIMDIAPTVLDLFGIERPAYMDGKKLEFKTDGQTA